jgi:hypothetical protein
MSHQSAPIRIAIGLLLAVSTATLGCLDGIYRYPAPRADSVADYITD